MIENLAVVNARNGAFVTISTASPSGCARCDAGKGCGGGVFGKLIDRRLEGLQLSDRDLNLQPGQYVMLGLDEGVFLRATAVTYGLPLLLMFVGAGLGQAMNWADAGSALSGIAGLVVGLGLAPRVRRHYVDRNLLPRILRRAQNTDMQVCGDA